MLLELPWTNLPQTPLQHSAAHHDYGDQVDRGAVGEQFP